MSLSINNWKELIGGLIVDRGLNGEEVFEPVVSGQNVKIACLELFNEKNYDYADINKCINKLLQADDQLNETLKKINKY